ncbi:hypothetical protein VTK26DRAFT_1846 [Humicola hyalothermophila]
MAGHGTLLIVAAAIALVVVIALLQALYNLFLHPLRSVPGPKLWAASYLPYTITWLTGRAPFVILALHERYGDTVRVTPSRLSFVHPDAWHEIRGHRVRGRAGHGEHGKDPDFFFAARLNLVGGDRAYHARVRRILSHAFSAKAMQQQQPLITRHIDLLMRRLRMAVSTSSSSSSPSSSSSRPDPPPPPPPHVTTTTTPISFDCNSNSSSNTTSTGDDGAVVNLAAWFNFVTFDIIGDLAFGAPFGCLSAGRYHPWVGAILRSMAQAGAWLAVQWHAPALLALLKVLSPRRYLGAHSDAQTEFARAMVDARVRERERERGRLGKEKEEEEEKEEEGGPVAGGRPDFLEAMLTARDEEGRGLSRDEVAANARLLVIAGSETTATALAGTVYLLGKYPDVQRRLAEEVRGAFKSEDEIDFLGVNRLKYMLAVLDESLRMFPPVPSPMSRICQPGGDVIQGVYVPEGTGLDIWSIAMHYYSRNFENPHDFIPERWLDGAEGRCPEKGRQGASQPFSVGPRNCIGRNLAYVEMRIILARLVWNYDLALADEASQRWMDCKTYILWLRGDLNVRLTPVVRADGP